MTVKILIKREVANSTIIELTILLKKLRSLTLSQPGYITGETLKRIDKPNECLVISTWRGLDDWNTWIADSKRIEIQTEIDKLLGQQTEYSIYET